MEVDSPLGADRGRASNRARNRHLRNSERGVLFPPSSPTRKRGLQRRVGIRPPSWRTRGNPAGGTVRTPFLATARLTPHHQRIYTDHLAVIVRTTHCCAHRQNS